MKIQMVMSNMAASARRLDCWYFLSPANATASIERAKRKRLLCSPLGGDDGLGSVWAPARFKRSYAAPGEPSVPYLRPYDVFNYLPEPADYLSSVRTKNLVNYQLRQGMILQTCSGRNLGPAVIVDRYLATFVLSHDMIRVEIADTRMRHYVLAFLNSRAGRSLLRRDKTGSVIDHISDQHLAKQEVLRLADHEFEQVSESTATAISPREKARIALHSMVVQYEERLPPLKRKKPLRAGWTVLSDAIVGRLDAAFYDPLLASLRRELATMGGKRVAEVADVVKPPGRYKTCYVDREHGRPLLSGAQLLQTTPINLQFMSPRVFTNIADYELRTGWIAYPADGRAEEELGTPVLITKDRDGWLASGHIGRVVANAGVDAGWLFLALKTTQAQVQLKARASGSVVDSTFAEDMEQVILPPPLDVDGAKVLAIWDDFREAQALEEQASQIIDDALAGFSK